jgi:hypothetical protein
LISSTLICGLTDNSSDIALGFTGLPFKRGCVTER